MAVRIRPATRDDLAGLVALEANFPTDRLSRASMRRFLSSPSAKVWVAMQAGAVVGNLILLLRRDADFGRVYSVVVDPAARGQGLGDRLVATAEKSARALGRRRLRLEVRQDNTPARALYAKRGYEEVAALAAYYEDGADGLRLEKRL